MASALGIHTSTRHLDETNIDWARLGRVQGADPVFAGRYFLTGRFSRVDGDERHNNHEITTVFAWAHGEASARVEIPARTPIPTTLIAPIQAGIQSRQETTGDPGESLGRIDGKAVCDRIRRAVAMGEFSISEKVNVFLEVPKGVKLSPEYWGGWAFAVSSYIVGKTEALNQPFLPSILCDYDVGTARQLVMNPEVNAALMTPPPPGRFRYMRCHGLWVRGPGLWVAPNLHPEINDATIAPFYQNIFGDAPNRLTKVRVLLWQYAGPPPSDASAGPPEDPAGVAGIDRVIANDEPSDLKDWMLTFKTPWAPPTDANAIFGFDTREKLSTDSIKCLAQAASKITAPLDQLPQAIGRNFSFAVRYYDNELLTSPSLKSMQPAEVKDLAEHGVRVAAVWQSARKVAGVKTMVGWSIDGVRYFTGGFDFGRKDGKRACEKADALFQPPWTPIYFGIEFSPQDIENVFFGPDLIPLTRAKFLDLLKDYMKGLAQGYIDYLAASENKIPYDIGVWAISKIYTNVPPGFLALSDTDVLEAAYGLGFVNYFWEISPSTSGRMPEAFTRARPFFPHVNMVQRVGNVRVNGPLGPDICGIGKQDRSGPVAPAFGPDGVPDGVDINLSWGDEGGWKARKLHIGESIVDAIYLDENHE